MTAHASESPFPNMKSALLLLLLSLCVSLHFTWQASAITSDLIIEVLEKLDNLSAIAVPPGQKLHVAYYAMGLQYYVFNGSAWVNFNATADLYALPSGGQKVGDGVVGKHFYLGHPDAAGGQPSWKTFKPAYSLVTARSISAITVDPKSITWNLFVATSHSGSKDLLGAVTYLQRLASEGGLPPSSTVGAHIGDIHVTPYSIIYAFYIKSI